jgi:hypothetical protein
LLKLVKFEIHHQGCITVKEGVCSLWVFIFVLLLQASPRLKLDEMIVKKLVFRIRSEVPNETWFDEIQAAVYEKLQVCHEFIMLSRHFAV